MEKFDQNYSWFADALCKGMNPNIFFPERGVSVNPAKKICSKCTVTHECLKYAIDNRIKEGIWGGKSERQRRAIRSIMWHNKQENENDVIK